MCNYSNYLICICIFVTEKPLQGSVNKVNYKFKRKKKKEKKFLKVHSSKSTTSQISNTSIQPQQNKKHHATLKFKIKYYAHNDACR